MNEPPVDVQDAFFHSLRQEEAIVEVRFLHGGLRMGRLKRFDKFALVIEVAGVEEMIYKHAIASIRAEHSAGRSPSPPSP